MAERVIEILFRRKWLVLLPLLIIVPLTSALSLRPRPQQWQSLAVVWVDEPRPLFGSTGAAAAESLGWTPAGNQALLLNQLVHTLSFSRSVLQQTRLASALQEPKTEDAALKFLWESVTVSPNEANFITIKVTMTDPDLAFKMAQVIVTNYQAIVKARAEAQTSIAVSVSDGALKQAEERVGSARDQLAAYLAANPSLARASAASSLAPEERDVYLSLLTEQLKTAVQNYDLLRQRSLNIEQGAAAGRETQPLTFNVVDKPERPLLPVRRTLISRLQLPVIGLVLGLLLSAGAAALLVFTDRTLLHPFDVESILNLKVLGEIPELAPQDARNRNGADTDLRVQLAASARRQD